MSELNVKQPLNWFWIFYRFDKINETIDEKKYFKQKLKFCLQMSILLMCLFQYFILCFGSNENFLFKFCQQYDIYKLMGPAHQLAYLGVFVAILFSMALALLLNHSNSSHYKWFEIIEVLNECKHFHRIGLNDYKFVDKYLKSIKKMKIILEISLIFIIFCCDSFSVFLVIIGFDLDNLQLCFTTIIWYLLIFSLAFPTIYYSFLFYYIVYQNCKVRIICLKHYTTLLETEILFFRSDTIEKIIKSSDKILSDIKSHNDFWSNYLQIVYYFMTPFSLITLIITMNNNLMFFLRFIGGSYLVFGLIVNLVFNLSTASINNEINKFYKNLNTFYVRNETLMNTRSKFKLINAMERCGERNRLIGLSCGQQFVITRQIAFKTIIIFFRFVLLSTRLLNTNS